MLSAERLPYTTGVIGGGEVLFGGEISLANGESYTTPWLVGSYGEGLNEVASRFHGYIRRVHRDWLVDHGIAPKPRPVILNTWEAVYFNHDYDTLTALADKAWKAASNDSSWTMAGSAPAVTTPPASATGRFRRTSGPTETSP